MSGPFCSQCGQGQAPLLPTVPELLRSTTSELLDLDARWVRSTVALLRHPGRLSVEWIEGKRTRWTSPLRLYLLTAALFFAILGVVGGSSSSAITDGAAGFVAGFVADDAISGDAARAAVAEAMELLPPAFLFLVPLGAGLLGSALRPKGRRFVEHLVTLVHVHAFAFLLWAPVAPLRLVTGLDVGGVVSAIIVWYVCRAIRRVYGPLSIRPWVGVSGVFLMYFISITLALGAFGVIRASG